MKPFRVAVMYGSQTGNAQSIAEGIHETCEQRGLESKLLKCDAWKKMTPELKEWNAVVLVVSTTGNGDPPENTERFWRFIKRRAQPKDLLLGMPFSVLGLGDTNYDKFCHMGKSFDKRLRELGAEPFHAPAFADEATNMEEVVEPWLASLYLSLDALRSGNADLHVENATVNVENLAGSTAVATQVQELLTEDGGRRGGVQDTPRSGNEAAGASAAETAATETAAAATAAEAAEATAAKEAKETAELTAASEATAAKATKEAAEMAAAEKTAAAKAAKEAAELAAAVDTAAAKSAAKAATAASAPAAAISPARAAPAPAASADATGGKAVGVGTEQAKAGGAAGVPSATGRPLPPHRIAVMYGSQTGNAQSIAEGVYQGCKERGLTSTLLACDGWKKMKPELKEWSALVLVVSTTGNGDAPENTERFWRFLKRRAQPKDLLQGLPFALLGLGDTNYDKFCHMGKSFDKRLQELGAEHFHTPAFADEATNMEEVVEPWLASLLPALEGVVAGKGSGNAIIVVDNGVDAPEAAAAGERAARAAPVAAAAGPAAQAAAAAGEGAGRTAAAAATAGAARTAGPSASGPSAPAAEPSAAESAPSLAVTGSAKTETAAVAATATPAVATPAPAVAPAVSSAPAPAAVASPALTVSAAVAAPAAAAAVAPAAAAKVSATVATSSSGAESGSGTASGGGLAETGGPLAPHRIAVMYGSQTGNAQSIAEGVHQGCKERGLTSTLLACDGWKKMKPELKSWSALVLVVSTTGNGDAPENTERFWRFLKRRAHPKDLLQGLPFALLGLGDTNYDKFCHMGKSFDKRLQELGAGHFHPPAFADEATNMEEVVEPWLASLLPALVSLVTARSDGGGGGGVVSKEGTGEKASPPPVASADVTKIDRSVPAAVVEGKEGGGGVEGGDAAEAAIKAAAMEAFGGSAGDVAAAGDDGGGGGGDAVAGDVNAAVVTAALTGLSLSGSAWSPSGESGVRPLSDFLSAEHLKPGYAPERNDLPRLRPSAPDVRFYSVEGSGSGGGGVGGGGDVGAERDVDMWLRRARQRSSSMESRHTSDWPFAARVKGARYLTKGGRLAERRVIHMELSLLGSGITYEPGDVIGIRCPNSTNDTEYVLKRLKETLPQEAGPDVPFLHSLRSLPSPCTLQDALSTRLDLQAPLRRPVLRALADCCGDPDDRARMELLCAKTAGPATYAKFVTEQSLTLCELLEAFPSCKPRAGNLLSLLPPLPPRYYSVASSQIANPSSVSVAFSVVSYRLAPPAEEGRREGVIVGGVGGEQEGGGVVKALSPAVERGGVVKALSPAVERGSGSGGGGGDGRGAIARRGLCTNWLEEILAPFLEAAEGGRNKAAEAGEGVEVVVPLFMKPTKEFLLPASAKWPCVLIGPGTGVSPFVGFLKHREEQLARQREDMDAVCSGYWRGGYEIALEGEEDETAAYRGREGRGDMWLFFGCRHESQDWIFREEMEGFLKKGTLAKLSTAFSRDSSQKVYVQDRIFESGKELSRLMLDEGAYIYVCGDGNAMAQGVHRTLVKVLMEHGGFGHEKEAESALKGMKDRKRYVLDVWS